MVHRYPDDSPFSQEAPEPNRSQFSQSGKDSALEFIGEDYDDAYIFYRPPHNQHFEGPFPERQIQLWYLEGYFYNSLEFKFHVDGPIETLESLKTKNGRQCPFHEPLEETQNHGSAVAQETLTITLGRLAELAEEVEKLKFDANISNTLVRRVNEVMERDKSNERYRRESEEQLNALRGEVEELKERLTMTLATACSEYEEDVETPIETNEITEETGEGCVTSTQEHSAVDHFITEDAAALRSEMEQLQESYHRLDKFTFKLSNKLVTFKSMFKSIDALCDGVNGEYGVYARLSDLEETVEEMREMLGANLDGRKTIASSQHKQDGIVIPNETLKEVQERAAKQMAAVLNDEEYVNLERKLSSADSTTEVFAAASESLTAVVAAAMPLPSKLQLENKGVQDDQPDTWESIEDGASDMTQNSLSFNENGQDVEEEVMTEEDTVTKMEGGREDKENDAATPEDATDRLDLLGKGMSFFLNLAKDDIGEMASDSDIDGFLTAVKSAKLLHIAESVKQYFGKPLTCKQCSSEDKTVELNNAIEYFEHVNRSHFKKCGGADKVLVKQFAYLLEQFKAPVPVPIALAKRQYAEREKNKPWLKREAISPIGKPNKKKK
ncbi:hypothetical protein PFISCL1PPCAC_6723 [Pristionchus fissidentatus]|uniref:GYF domain-containing protein n=1 Tax=Pristionchus fissidentatus TaxID=1538716 RepID=A0AAV5V9K8_9BILA|nr:hypothetical protein PFISCL1PPCAC_6723 [Pristionchus fissidentatus]